MSTHSDDSIGAGCNDSDNTMLTVGSEARGTVRVAKPNLPLQIAVLKAALVFVVLCLATTTTMTVVYRKQSEQNEVDKDQFDSFADKVLDAFMDIGSEKMASAGSLVLAMVAHGIDHSREWPFIALSSFQQRSSTTKLLSGAILIETHPIVWDEERAEWENYTLYDDDRNWYEEGRAYQQDLGIDELDTQMQIETDDPNLSLSSGVANQIYTVGEGVGDRAIVSPSKRYYLPIWQTSPVAKRTIVNLDDAAKSQGITACLDRDAVVFEGMRFSEPGYIDSPNPTTSNMAWLLHMADGNATKYNGDIFTTVHFPIYNNFAIDRTTVGVMSIVIYWARYFRGILPKQVQGIVFVLDNGCDDPYTYQINGVNVIPLGHGDRHDPKYDHYEREATFREIKNIPDGTKFGLLLFQGRCPYTIRVYPSDSF